MSCIEEKTCDIVVTFRWCPVIRRQGHCAHLVTPLVWHFVTKFAAVKFALPWMSNHFSWLREHNYVSSSRYPEWPIEDWWGKPCWLNRRESEPEVVQGQGGVTASSTLLGPVLVWSQQTTLSEIAVDREVFQVFLWMLPSQPSLEENRAWKWMDWIAFTLVYSPVFKSTQVASEPVPFKRLKTSAKYYHLTIGTQGQVKWPRVA